jgi:hypothetical protein
MRTKRIKLYKIHELPETTKRKVLDNLAARVDYSWYDENEGSLEKFAFVFPIRIKNYRYGFDFTDINFEFCGDNDIKELCGNRLRTYLINNYYEVLYERKIFRLPSDYGMIAKIRKSKILWEGTCMPLTGYHMDCDILRPIKEFIKSPEVTTTFVDLLDACLWSWLYSCKRDFEYSYSDDYLIEYSNANEREYLITGELYV